MSSNPFLNHVPLPLGGPATDIIPVVPSDDSDLGSVAASLYVENGGVIVIVTVKGEVRTVEVGDLAILPVGVLAVRAAGTTASGIHALVVS